jgi:hypothetical protein
MVVRRKIVHLLKIVLAWKRYFQKARQRLASNVDRNKALRDLFSNEIVVN